MKKRRTCMVAVVYLSSFPFFFFFGKCWMWSRFVATLLHHETHKAEYLMLLGFLLAFHYKGLGAHHFAIVPLQFSASLVQHCYSRKPPTKSPVLVFSHHLMEVEAKQATSEARTAIPLLQGFSYNRFFSLPVISKYIPSAYLHVKT